MRTSLYAYLRRCEGDSQFLIANRVALHPEELIGESTMTKPCTSSIARVAEPDLVHILPILIERVDDDGGGGAIP